MQQNKSSPKLPQNRNRGTVPRRNSGSSPPPTMTWGKASPVLVVAVIFDLARNFFEWFWLFGPALFAVGCTAGMNSYIGTTITQLSGKAVAVGCMALAGVAGYFGVEVTEGFGIMMAALDSAYL